jgi:hypothetical protein
LRECVFWGLAHVLRFATRVPLVSFIFMGVLFLVCPTTALAQDLFEIHVYEYEELPPGGFTLEGHFNFVGIGTNLFDGQLAPTNHQFHMTGELTGGITRCLIASAKRSASSVHLPD